MEINLNSKYLKNKKENKKTYKKYLVGLSYRILISVLIFLSLAIYIKASNKNKEIVYQNIYNNNFLYTKAKKYYDKYLKGVYPFSKIFKEDTNLVFNETLHYTAQNKYLDGVKLTVDTNYLVPVLKSGIVIYIGEKPNYGSTVIIQGTDEIEIWYANISNINVSLYDYVTIGTLLGEVKDNNFYLVYSQNGKYLNYEEFLK